MLHYGELFRAAKNLVEEGQEDLNHISGQSYAALAETIKKIERDNLILDEAMKLTEEKKQI